MQQGDFNWLGVPPMAGLALFVVLLGVIYGLRKAFKSPPESSINPHATQCDRSEIQRLLREGDKLRAMGLVSKTDRVGFLQAKAVVEAIEREMALEQGGLKHVPPKES